MVQELVPGTRKLRPYCITGGTEVNEPDDYRNFLRMDSASFDELLGLVTPFIQKEDTIMRQSISPMERLSLTLRYLATGNTYENLKFTTAISLPSLLAR